METIIIFLNILLLEVILSVDNASVLAVIVNKNLSNESERSKALRYGILGAYAFRGLSLLFVSFIIYNPSIGAWFKIFGGIYLCYLFITHLTPEVDSIEEGNTGFLERVCKKIGINNFWTTVIVVEIMDIVFSIDNLVACVSLSNDIYVVCGAVFVGIFAMRFVAKYFSKLLIKYPSLEGSAFFVILLLGLKMAVAGVFDFFPQSSWHELLNSHHTDMIFSLLTLVVFAIPVIAAQFKRNKKDSSPEREIPDNFYLSPMQLIYDIINNPQGSMYYEIELINTKNKSINDVSIFDKNELIDKEVQMECRYIVEHGRIKKTVLERNTLDAFINSSHKVVATKIIEHYPFIPKTPKTLNSKHIIWKETIPDGRKSEQPMKFKKTMDYDSYLFNLTRFTINEHVKIVIPSLSPGKTTILFFIQ